MSDRPFRMGESPHQGIVWGPGSLPVEAMLLGLLITWALPPACEMMQLYLGTWLINAQHCKCSQKLGRVLP